MSILWSLARFCRCVFALLQRVTKLELSRPRSVCITSLQSVAVAVLVAPTIVGT